jgi:hypothetical protein
MSGSNLLAAMAIAAAMAAPALAGAATYGEVDSVADLGRVFAAIRADVDKAGTRADLRRLDHRAGYLVTLTYSRPWRVKFGDQLPRLHEEAVRQFKATVQEINRRAGAIGTQPDFQENWGDAR